MAVQFVINFVSVVVAKLQPSDVKRFKFDK